MKSNVPCLFKLCYPVARVFYSTISYSSEALESSGSMSASAAAIIFQSQTVLFYSLGRHFLLFCIPFMGPRPQRIFKDCC